MFKFFTSDLRRNLIKILCLTVGLAVGFLLVAKIYFEQTYDSFFPNIDRLYKVTESVDENGEYKEYDFTPGGTAVELQRNIPQIEVATRITDLTGGTNIKLEDGRLFGVDNFTLADTCFFDVLSTPIIEGNPHEILAVETQVMIPRSLAEKIGGEVIGLRFSVIDWGDDFKATIGGVYEDYPLNSSIENAVYMAMPTIKQLFWDGTENLLGNDRYVSYVLLTKGTDPEELHPKILSHLKGKLPETTFTISDYKVWLRPLMGRYSSQAGVKTMSWMLGMLAVIMLMCAGLNYLLIVIGQLAARGKEMAIRKCYGTDRKKLFLRVMGESLFFLVISLVLAILLSFSLSDLCNELLGYTPQQLFSTGQVWVVEGSVCLALFILTGIIPSIIYSRTPVTHAFRPATHGRKGWKLALLALQFFATGLIMCLLVLVGRQYSMVGNLKIGLDYENIGVFMRNGLSEERLSTIMEEVQKLPFVELASTSNRDLSDPASGNNMWTEGKEENQVNIADMEFINPDMIDVMGIKFLQGGNFHENADSITNEIIVEERFIGVLQKYFGETDNDIVGKSVYITGHADVGPIQPFTIVGVIENIHRGGFEIDRADTRAGVLFPMKWKMGRIFVRFTELTPENLKAVQRVINSLKDDEEIYITPYKSHINAKRNTIRRFGTSVMVVGIAIILIALIGLIGYVADEVNRRAKEIAIRKVNGTPAAKIVRLFCIDILKVAVPSLILGGAVAMIVGQHWLAQFTDRVSLSPLSMVICLIVLLLLITSVVVINSLRVARSNPVEHLRSE
ncbi:MAG: ABC transporter permease [Muribaculaceae bacterium]|nr:ABC transporter permease [Muribaculaceae bacterium]